MSDTTLPAFTEITKRTEDLQLVDPALTFAAAQEKIIHDDPDLWQAYVYEQRHGRPAPSPVVKAAAVPYSDIVTAVRLRAARDGVTMAQAFAADVTKMTPRHPEWYAAYRQWQTGGEGLDAYLQERIAKLR